MLTLAFDTATAVATSALVDTGSKGHLEVLGERCSRAQTLLEDVCPAGASLCCELRSR